MKPQLDEAIAYLQAEIAALCAKDTDKNILGLAVAVAAGKAPLPEAQFGPLLAVWTPKTSSIASELAALVDQYKASKRREEAEEKRHGKEENRHVKRAMDSARERRREEKRRSRTRPRRRFDDFDKRDASPSASDDTLTSFPKSDGVATDVEETMKGNKKMKEVKSIKMEEKEKNEEKKEDEMEEDIEIEENKMETKKQQMERKKNKMMQVVVEKEKRVENDEMKKNNVGKNKVTKSEVKKNVVETDVAPTAMESLQTLRKSMLLDVLSKIVSVAKSKDVDPAMFTLTNGENQVEKDENQVDLITIKGRVAEGVICEWAQFAEQVYLFCQHVVTDAELREQPEARRKGVELLHFARTLTDTLRKVSITKEAMLLQTIREAEMKAAARIKEKEAACNEKEIKNDTVEESIADENDDEAMKTTVFEFHASRSKTTNDKSLDLGSFSSLRATTRIRKRTSIASDGTGSAAPSPSSSNSRKRMCVASVSAASASEEVSGSESLDASASEADTKLHEQSEMTKSPAKLAPAHRRRPLLPATRISSRQQKRRAAAAAAAAAAVDSTGSGNEEEHSGSEALPLVAEREYDDANEKNENARDVEQEGEQSTPKMKKVAPKTRSRRKRWRKR